MDNNVREKFNKCIESLVAKKRGDNKALLSVAEYDRRVKDVKASKIIMSTRGAKRQPRDYKNVRKYDVHTAVDGTERLVKKSAKDKDRGDDDDPPPLRFYVTNDDLFDILDMSHVALCHGGRDKMVSYLKKKYCNITKESIMTYLNLCVHCDKKSSAGQRRTGGGGEPAVSRPISSSQHRVFSSRAQMDLIDMESQSYNGYRYIMNHQDHSTKFVMLRPLRTQDPVEIASNLTDIYTTFGAPAILHFDDDRQFVIRIFRELEAMWGDIKIVHGKPEHCHSQWSIERANRDVEDMLVTWMAENHSKDWPTALKFIQFRKNRAFYSGIGKSPYEAMFGCPPKLGVASVGFPMDEVKNLNTEEDMEAFINSQPELCLDDYSDIH